MAKNNPTKHNGYIYSSKTKAGFLRMQRLGIPRPPFRIEDSITRKLAQLYKEEIERMALEFAEEAVKANAGFKGTALTSDADIKAQVSKITKGTAAAGKTEEVNKTAVGMAAGTLKQRWFETTDLPEDVKAQLRQRLEVDFESGKNNFYKQFFKDCDQQTLNVFVRMSLDKQEVFNSRIKQLQGLYIDNALERIAGEENELKKKFLEKLVDYSTGKSAGLDVSQLVNEMSQTSTRVARFFARDQMARFNKALTVSTFQSAGATKMKWCTCHDQRVRASHKALDGKIFPVDQPPKEIDDYNCRCGLIPVWDE